MQKAFEKIVERLEELKNNQFKVGCCDGHDCEDADDECSTCYLNRAIEIVNQVAGEYKHVTTCYIQSPCEYQNEDIRLPEVEFVDDNGWIPCAELVPVETDEDLAGDYLDNLDELIEQGVFKPYLVTIEGAKVPTELYYVGYAGEVLWYDEITEEFYKVIAWQELPPVYQPKGE